MPRSRRRHHSHSRSRSRSHSHDRDREAKRRKIDNYESPHHRRTVSDGEEPEDVAAAVDEVKETPPVAANKETEATPALQAKLEITPKKTQSPRQLQKKLESEKKRLEKQREREERERKKLEEKERARAEKERARLEREEQKTKDKMAKQKQKEAELEAKQKEKEAKEVQRRKERDEKEQKRKEKEEREDQKRKEKELERQKRQQEADEKNKERQKLEEQKQKAAAAFATFFVAKKSESADGGGAKPQEKRSLFKDFEVKSEMRLAPLVRRLLSEEEKQAMVEAMGSGNPHPTYLEEMRKGKPAGRSARTWPCGEDDDVQVVEDDLGTTIDEQKPKLEKMRVKFLWFHDNQRPPYYGTWRKKSKAIKPREPLARDKDLLDYDVDSDDDWEEEEQGESLNGSEDEAEDDADKENEYEEDNVFFVPHGHLSDDEVDDEENAALDPEGHKAKLKLLKNEFDEEMRSTTKKFQPRSIGCVFYPREGAGVDEAIDKFLKPFSMITNGREVVIKKRGRCGSGATPKSSKKLLVF